MSQIIYANWKMNQQLSDIENFFSNLSDVEINYGIASQFIHLPKLIEFKRKFPRLKAGAQHCATEEFGALPGEGSPISLKDLGADFVILGHSERREHFGENTESLRLKIELCLKADLQIIFCIGETLQEREADQTFNVLKNQLRALNDFQFNKEQLILAYEPVWAIGTGVSASADQAQKTHAFIKNELHHLDIEGLNLLYGGSVKSQNAESFFQQKDIDGALVGGASLKAKSFKEILRTANCNYDACL